MSMIFDQGGNGANQGSAGGASASDGGELIKDADLQSFGKDVIELSAQVPVIVDFWAPWCEPCKQLTPILEAQVKAAAGAVRLVKVNIDDNPELAQHLQVRSVPTVYGFKNGQPVDGFAGAQPESQIKAFIERLAGPIGPSPVDQMIEQANTRIEGGDLSTAAQMFGAILQEAPEEPRAIGGLARCYLLGKDLERARQTLDMAPEALKSDPAIASVVAELELAEGAADSGETDDLKAKLEADPNDHQARFDLASALAGAGNKEQAIEELLELMRRDRKWNDEAARKQLLTLFEALGAGHDLAISGRRRLSSILFS